MLKEGQLPTVSWRQGWDHLNLSRVIFFHWHIVRSWNLSGENSQCSLWEFQSSVASQRGQQTAVVEDALAAAGPDQGSAEELGLLFQRPGILHFHTARAMIRSWVNNLAKRGPLVEKDPRGKQVNLPWQVTVTTTWIFSLYTTVVWHIGSEV